LGKKYLMAITGIGLFLFVIGHMLGNLQFLIPDGGEAINKYGHFLQSTPEILWPARIGLLALVIIHIAAGLALTIENRQAREQQYAEKKIVDATLASRTMLVSGGVIFAFVGYHLAHFTLMTTHPEFRDMHDAIGRHDVHRMMVAGFSNAYVSGFYVLAVGLLCFHLSHGVAAMFQSLGLQNEVYKARIETFAKIAAVILFLGYAAIPVSVWAGVVK
jgi:succinate dehydrogenase / fumarate reductase cytochrome b subunit